MNNLTKTWIRENLCGFFSDLNYTLFFGVNLMIFNISDVLFAHSSSIRFELLENSSKINKNP